MKNAESSTHPLITETVSLARGDRLHLQGYRYPIESPLRMRIIDLIQRQWDRTDVDWLQTMRGQWSDTLTIEACVASINGKDMGTAQVAYARLAPEVNIVMDVMVVPDGRGKGIGGIMTDWIQEYAFSRGSRVAYLGNRPGPSVYERIGFERLGGVFMRKPADPKDLPEEDFYRSGQKIKDIRPVVPGDLPGIVCLNAQPHQTAILQFDQGVVSRLYAPPAKAVSSFSSVWDSVKSRNGVFLAAEGDNPHRILGYGTLIPGPRPCQSHWANLDFVSHDAYPELNPVLIEKLLSKAGESGAENLETTVSEVDTLKQSLLQNFGFREVCRLPQALRCGDRDLDAVKLVRV